MSVRRGARRHRCARCGYEKTYLDAGAAEARYWFSKHSCRRHEERQLRAFLAEAKRDQVDRTPKPCLHKRADHQHGTRACYVLDRCRCLPCSAANSTAEQDRKRQKAYGRYNKYVPAGPVREHIQELRQAGMGLKRIAAEAGIGTGTISKIVYGGYQATGTGGGRNGPGVRVREPSRRVLRSTAEKIYAIDPTWTGRPVPIAAGARDPARTPIARLHLRSLVALGWSMSELGRRLGIRHPGNATVLFTNEQRVMQARTIDAVEELFGELCMTLPPDGTAQQQAAVARSKAYAAARGWLTPLALDDLAIDEAGGGGLMQPDHDDAAIERRMAGDRTVRLTPPEAAELVRRWKVTGRSLAELERVTGLNARRYHQEAS